MATNFENRLNQFTYYLMNKQIFDRIVVGKTEVYHPGYGIYTVLNKDTRDPNTFALQYDEYHRFYFIYEQGHGLHFFGLNPECQN